MPNREGPKLGKYRVAVPVARRVILAGVTLGLRRQARLIEAMGLANRSEVLGRPGPVDESEGVWLAWLVQGPSIKLGICEARRAKPPSSWGPGWLGPVGLGTGLAGQAQNNHLSTQANALRHITSLFTWHSPAPW